MSQQRKKRKTSRGNCTLCGKIYSKGTITRHLNTCQEKTQMIGNHDKATRMKTHMFHIVVEGRHRPMYWLHLDIPGNTKLESLDRFLRDIWLECCGHLSAFTINGITYSSYSETEFDDRSMNVTIDHVLSPGLKCMYEYDFGSTTELKVHVISDRKTIIPVKVQKIMVLARNLAPEIPCDHCGEPSTQICMEHCWSGNGWFCERCSEEHGCSKDMMLSVVNSPRVGVCAYNG